MLSIPPLFNSLRSSSLLALATQRPYISAVVVAVVTGLVSFALDAWFLPKIGVLLILQLGVVTVALLGEKPPAIIAGVLGAFTFNYFFTEPRYSLHMTDIEDIVNMLVFLVIAVITSILATSYHSQREALKRAQLRSNILLSVSHDLRTPLSTIIGTLSTLQVYGDKLSKTENNELVEAALDESHRLHRYVENLLQATKLQHGEMVLNTTEQSVMPVINEVVARFNTTRIKVEAEQDLPLVSIRESLLGQALYNVIDNGLLYSDAESPVIVSVTCAQSTSTATTRIKKTATQSQSKPQQVVDICVQDFGPGIDQSLQQKVFDLFYSSRQGDSGDGGTGLGLAVADGIVKAHGGQITILPSIQGCKLNIRLPAVNPTHAEATLTTDDALEGGANLSPKS